MRGEAAVTGAAMPSRSGSAPPASLASGASTESFQRWELGRRGSLQPQQLLVGCALPCGLGLLPGLGFAILGCPWPLVFALLQCIAMAVAFLVQVRHGADRAVLTLRGGWLEVVKRRGSRLSVRNLPLVCLRMRADARGLRLECGASILRIQGYASPAACARVLRELEQARGVAATHANGAGCSASERWASNAAC